MNQKISFNTKIHKGFNFISRFELL